MRPQHQPVGFGRIQRFGTRDHPAQHRRRCGILFRILLDDRLFASRLDLQQLGSTSLRIDIDDQVPVDRLHSDKHLIDILPGGVHQIIIGGHIDQDRPPALYRRRIDFSSIFILSAGEKQTGYQP